MFHGRQINDKINKLYERALRIVCNDTITSFEELLVKDKTFTIHHQNIQSLAIEMYKAVNNLPGGNLSEFFVRNNHNYNLRSRSELTVPSINTVFKGQNSISYFGSVIWNSIPAELKRINSFQVFRSEKSMATNKLPIENLHRKLRFRQYCFLVGQIYIYFYLSVDFNHSLDSV